MPNNEERSGEEVFPLGFPEPLENFPDEAGAEEDGFDEEADLAFLSEGRDGFFDDEEEGLVEAADLE